MASKSIAVYGIYSSRPMVENAVAELINAGFRSTDISVLFTMGKENKTVQIINETKTSEGVTTRVGTSTLIGGALILLAGISVLAIPGLEPFIAAEPVVAALAGVGAGGFIGGVGGAMIGRIIPGQVDSCREGKAEKEKESGILLSVTADDSDWKNKGKNILERTGAQGDCPQGPNPVLKYELIN